MWDSNTCCPTNVLLRCLHDYFLHVSLQLRNISYCQSISKLAYLILLFCALSSPLSMYTVLQPVYILFSFQFFVLTCNSLYGLYRLIILKTLSVLSTNHGREEEEEEEDFA